jgi:hypothetical protein
MKSALPRLVAWLLGMPLVACAHGGGEGADPTVPPGDTPAFPFIAHMQQARINAGSVRFEELFSFGDALFSTAFNGMDGSGALLLPDGTALPGRFSRIPPGGGRFTGPNGNACLSCHNLPLEDGAGEASSNVLQDPSGLGILGLAETGGFNPRNAVALFAPGAIQGLAEEMTEKLQALRDQASAEALGGGVGTVAWRDLVSKGVNFGRIQATQLVAGRVTLDTSEVVGVDPDLVVRPYGWKGNVTTLRDFVRGASQDELGMQAVELVSKNPAGEADPETMDLDGDGVANEFSVGDVTALTVYLAAQPVPAEVGFLVSRGLVAPPSSEVGALQVRGRTLFSELGCGQCHLPEMQLDQVEFREPSLGGGGAYQDPDLVRWGVDGLAPSRVDLVQQGDGLRLVPHSHGGARVALFGDLKRHNMGKTLADPQPTLVSGADGRTLVLYGARVSVPKSVFLTPELWGVGNTGPWLHDGRAGTLEEAILLHGVDPLKEPVPPLGDPERSEAQAARDAFAALAPDERVAVVEFLKGLVLFRAALAGEAGS